MAMQWQPKIPKEKKISQSNVILEEITEKFKNIQWQKKEDKHHPLSTNVHLRYMAKKCWWKVDICCQSTLSTWHLHRPVILPQIPVAQFALEIKFYCKEEEDPRGHPMILHVGTLPDLNWLKMQILGVILVTVLWEEWAKTPRPVLNTPESWQSKGQSLKSQPWNEHPMQILFL